MRKALVFVLFTIVLFCGVTIGAYEFNFQQTIIPRVSVVGVELSGMTKEEAKIILEKEVEERGQKLILLGKEKDRQFFVKDLGVYYQIPETVETAWQLGRNEDFIGNYQNKIEILRHKKELPLKFDLDQIALEVLIASVAAETNNAPIEPKLELNKQGEVVFVQGKNGEVVDQEELVKRIESALGTLELLNVKIPTETKVVEKNEEEVALIKNRANELVKKELKLKTENFNKIIKGKEVVRLIGLNKESWDQEKIREISRQVGVELDREAQEARFEFKNERLADFSPDLDGIKVEQEALTKMIIQGLENNQEEIQIPIQKTLAKIKSGEINNLGIKEKLGTGTSTYLHSIAGRVHNVSLAASRINGVLVPPGEIFSFNKTLGDISAATGYESAYIIKDGRTVLGDGGGVCQVSTTLFRAVLSAGLPIVERHAHAYRVSYYEQDSKPGLDATVYDPTADLKFKNDTDNYLLIQTQADSTKYKLNIEIYGTGDSRTVTITTPKVFSSSPPPEDLYVDDPTLPKGSVKQIDWKAFGAKVAFDYLVEKNGEIIFKKTFYSNYQPWQAVYLRGTGG